MNVRFSPAVSGKFILPGFTLLLSPSGAWANTPNTFDENFALPTLAILILVLAVAVPPLLSRAFQKRVEERTQELQQQIDDGKRLEQRARQSELILREVFDGVPDAILLLNTQAEILDANRQVETLFGVSPAQIRTLDLLSDLSSPRNPSRENMEQLWTGVLRGNAQSFEWIACRIKDRYEFDVEVYLRRIRYRGQVAVLATLHDISARKWTENQLMHAEANYRTIFENVADGIYQSSIDGLFLQVNPAFARMLGYEDPADVMRSIEHISTHFFTQPQIKEELLERLEAQTEVTGFEAEVYRKDGSTLWVSISARGRRDSSGKVRTMEGVAQDISARKRAEQELRAKATTDQLTGLPNRYLFNQAFGRMLAQARRADGYLAMLFLDLDGFKPINDNFGHDTGDRVLQQVAQRIRNRLRQSDMAARLGGDEFGILLWDIDGDSGVEEVCLALNQSLSQPYAVNGSTHLISVSIGAALYPRDGLQPDRLMQIADSAMYQVKQEGKNGYQIATNDLEPQGSPT